MNREGDSLTLLFSFPLKRSRSPQRGIKGQILCLSRGRAGLDVAAAPLFGAGARATTSFSTG